MSTGGGSYPRWSRDGRELFFYAATTNKIVAAAIDARGDTVEIGALTPLFDARAPEGFARYFYDVAPDGRFLLTTSASSTTAAMITLMVNWPSLLDAKR